MTIKIMIMIMIMMKMILLLFPRMIYLELQLFFVTTHIQVEESESNWFKWKKINTVDTANKTETVFLPQPTIHRRNRMLHYIQVNRIFISNRRTLINNYTVYYRMYYYKSLSRMIANCNNFIVTIIIQTLLCLWIGTTTYSRSSYIPVFDGTYDVFRLWTVAMMMRF